MVLVFPSFLMVVDHMVVDLPKAPHQSLLVTGILTSRDLSIEPMHNLKTISKIVLHGGGTGLIVEHVKHLAKVHGRAIGSPVSDQPEHDAVSVVLQLDILVHPYFT
uniref:C5 n=1 Tax=Tomato leaf deformation virus TaxID=681518 RepID=K4PD92_9GEMI|nr:C5 [Tomato leaf deformation virus]